MKVFQAAIALVAAIATTDGADAAKPKNKQEWKKTLDHRMKNGLFDKATLMSKATPHSDAAKKRKLDEVEITGVHSVQFQNCFSLTESYEEIFENDDDGTGMMLMSQGKLLPMRSYSIFRLCYNSNCNSYNPMDYVVDLDTYIQALVNYLPTQMENFCEGCQDNYDSCMSLMYGGYGNGNNNNNQNYNVNYQSNGSGSYNNNGQQQQNSYNNGYNNNNNNGNGYNRKLADLHDFEQRVLNDNGQVVKQLDCYLCDTYGCLKEEDDDNENDMYGFEAATEWLEDLSQCKETGISYSGGYGGGYNNNNNNNNNNNGDGNELYGGFVCNADGNGVEIGLFLDEECVLYLPNEPYSNYMSYFDQTYIEMTKEIIEFTFSSAVFSCKDEEVTWTTQDVSGYNMYNYDGNGDGDGDVAEWCEDLFDGDSVPVDVNTCGMYSNNYNNNNQNNNQNQNAEDYNYNDQNYQQYYGNTEEGYQQQADDDYQYKYDWYRFEIDEESSLDMYTVCTTMKRSGGDLHTFYNSDNGALYNYGSSSASDSISEFLEDTDTEVSYGTTAALYARAQKLSGVEKFGIVAGTGVLVGAAAALYLKFRSSAEDSKNIGLMDDDDDAVEQSRTGEIA